MTIGCWEVFDEVKGDQVPRTGRNWELLDEAEGFVSWGLVSFAGNTAVDIVLDICPDVRPGVLPMEQLKSPVLAGVAHSDMIMFELEDSSADTSRFRTVVRNVNPRIN